MQNIKLNLIPGSVMPVVNVSQYDKARQFTISVYEGSAAYSLTGKDVQIRGTKPDGNGFAYDSTDGVVSVSGSTVTISTTQQMTAVGGQTMAELRITQSGVILGTLNFVLMVEPSALSDDTPISDTDIPAIERDFEAALAEAEADALKAEGYAVGTQDGVPAQSGEPYYQDNAKYYKEQAEAAASGGGADALKAEGYAVGTQNGVPVTSGSPYYHNNAAYYEGEASTSATNAATSETNAGLSETAAGNSATSAAADALVSEGWAVGKQNGTPVTSGSPYYQNNAEYYKDQAAQYAAGGLNFKGSVAFASIPTTGMVNGDEYNITDDFTTDNRFIEGSGISVKAGTNIAWIGGSTNKWDLLATGGGGASTLDDLTDVTLTSQTSGQVLEYDGSKWANANLPTVPSDLDDLSDVTLSSPTSGQFLKYDGAKWVNGSGGGGASALDDLTDVDITTPTDGQVLTYDAQNQKWVNAAGGGGGYKIMTARFNLSDSDPTTWGEYLDDAVGMTAGSDDWDTFIGHYLCILDNGEELGELNQNDCSKYKDGTSAPITTLGKDVMVCFPRRGLKIWIDSGYLYVSMTDRDNATGYSYLAHTYKGDPCDKFYLGKYKGLVNSSKLYSISGKTPGANATIGSFRNYAQARGAGYEQSAFFQLTYRQAMYMLKYLGNNPQSVIGMGYSVSNSSIHSPTGYTNNKGMDWGESTGKYPMTLFGIEDFYGNNFEWIDGIKTDASRMVLAADGNYNDAGTGYTAVTSKTSANNYAGYLKTVLGTDEGGFVADVTTVGSYGSSSTYFCDSVNVDPSCVAIFGGSWIDSGALGVFRLRIDNSTSTTGANRGARLMYMHVAA